MARCPFAIWRPISGGSGPHLSGPFKIVHHTTEGSTAQSALNVYERNRPDPHFTVDATTIIQHVDTDVGARSLRNAVGGTQTNRESAIQIELVGFAHVPKGFDPLANVARLCRWIEKTHGVPKVWPSGPPKPAKNGKDPGGHNLNPSILDRQGGHYGHCHVAENTHWDPAYSTAEADLVQSAACDSNRRPTSPAPAVAGKGIKSARRIGLPKPTRRRPIATAKSTMPDHSEVDMGLTGYIRHLRLLSGDLPPQLAGSTKVRRAAAKLTSSKNRSAQANAKVNVGWVLSFVDGPSKIEMDDVLMSVQPAQRGASGYHDRFTESRAWDQKYVEILENLGWVTSQMAFSRYDQSGGEFRVDEAALAIIAAIATQNQLVALQEALSALDKMAEDDGSIRMFEFKSSLQGSGNFQLGSVQRSDNGAPTVALGAFYFRSTDERRHFLSFKWGAKSASFWTSAQRITLNPTSYADLRQEVEKRRMDGHEFIDDLRLGLPRWRTQ